MSLQQKVLLLTLLLRKKRRQRRLGRLWAHPITSARLTEGAHYLLFKELEDDPTKFFNYFRIIQIVNTNIYYCISSSIIVSEEATDSVLRGEKAGSDAPGVCLFCIS